MPLELDHAVREDEQDHGKAIAWILSSETVRLDPIELPIMRLFLSCVSSEFKSYRLKLANHLAATGRAHSRSRSRRTFIRRASLCWSNWRTLSAVAISSSIWWAMRTALGQSPSTCGRCYFPWARHSSIPCRSGRTRRGNTAARGGSGSRSWSTSPGPTRRDRGLPVQQSDDDARLQRAHRDEVFRSGKHYDEFASPTSLVREVFYDLGLNPQDRQGQQLAVRDSVRCSKVARVSCSKFARRDRRPSRVLAVCAITASATGWRLSTAWAGLKTPRGDRVWNSPCRRIHRRFVRPGRFPFQLAEPCRVVWVAGPRPARKGREKPRCRSRP